jgi:hypothetical protein
MCSLGKMLPNFLINMLHLKRLYIYECPLLNRILLPSDMPLLTGLEDLRIDGCPELYIKYHPQCGKHWPAISQINASAECSDSLNIPTV